MDIIEQEIRLGYSCPGVDEQRLRQEMTDEEYYAYRHGGLVY